MNKYLIIGTIILTIIIVSIQFLFNFTLKTYQIMILFLVMYFFTKFIYVGKYGFNIENLTYSNNDDHLQYFQVEVNTMFPLRKYTLFGEFDNINNIKENDLHTILYKKLDHSEIIPKLLLGESVIESVKINNDKMLKIKFDNIM